jgi:hypothetical protein
MNFGRKVFAVVTVRYEVKYRRNLLRSSCVILRVPNSDRETHIAT